MANGRYSEPFKLVHRSAAADGPTTEIGQVGGSWPGKALPTIPSRSEALGVDTGWAEAVGTAMPGEAMSFDCSQLSVQTPTAPTLGRMYLRSYKAVQRARPLRKPS